MRKYLAAVAVALLLSSVGATGAGAYVRNKEPALTGLSCAAGFVTLTWDTKAGKPETYTVYFDADQDFGTIPKAAISKGRYVYATPKATNGRNLLAYLSNATGNSAYLDNIF